jgi:hypothetical protein
MRIEYFVSLYETYIKYNMYDNYWESHQNSDAFSDRELLLMFIDVLGSEDQLFLLTSRTVLYIL